MTGRKTNILTLAVNKRMCNVLEMFFEHHCNGVYQLTTNKKYADIIVSDVDSYSIDYPPSDLPDKYPDMPIIVFSINDADQLDQQLVAKNNYVFFLKKPIVLQQLKDTLIQCSQIISDKKLSNNQLTKRSTKEPEQKVKQRIVSAAADYSLSDNDLTKPTKAIKKNPVVDLTNDLLTNKSPEPVNPVEPCSTKDEKTADVLLVPPTERPKEDAPDDAKAKPAIDAKEDSKNLLFIGRRGDIDLKNSKMIKKNSFNPQGYIYYYLKNIINNKEKDTLLYINIADEYELYIAPDGRFIKSPTPSSKRKAVASYYFKDMEIQEQESTMGWDEIEGKLIQSNALLWELALWAARGRLPAGTNLDQPIKLKHWPDITQYVFFPHAVKMAAVWSKHALSIKEIIDKLKIPQRYVFSFYVACQAIDMFDCGKVAAPVHITQSEVEATNKKVGTFKRILTHLIK